MFETDTKNPDPVSMTQVLGLCSGHFKNDETVHTGMLDLPVDPETQSDNLLSLCTGTFSTQKESGALPTDSDIENILDLCSGKFTTQTQASHIDKKSNFEGLFDSTDKKSCDVDVGVLGFCSGNFTTQTDINTSSLTSIKDKDFVKYDESAVDFSIGDYKEMKNEVSVKTGFQGNMFSFCCISIPHIRIWLTDCSLTLD